MLQKIPSRIDAATSFLLKVWPCAWNSAVLQHDIAIEPEACGGPLLKGNGHVIGVNPVRRGSEATLAILIEDMIGFSG